MHIRDGILSPEVCLAAGVLATAAVGYSLRRMRLALDDRAVPLTGMMAAVVFAGQMVNFPLFGLPVSGHLLGGVLAAAVVGPWAGCVALSVVLIVQAVLFADGGLLSLGPNILNMAVVGCWGGYAVFATVRRWSGSLFPSPGASLGEGQGEGAFLPLQPRDKTTLTPHPSPTEAAGEGSRSRRPAVFAAVVAAYVSVLAAAALFCAEFALSSRQAPFDLSQLTLWMVLYHALIGVGEAAITGAVLSFVWSRRPELLTAAEPGTTLSRGGRFVTAGATVACAVAAILSPWASSWPDGLEAVGERVGFNELGVDRMLMLSDYAVPLPAGWEVWSVSAAGVLGTVVVLGVGWLLCLRPSAATTLSDGQHAG
ncbi:MAG: energy-coupling factor ABC transporter permease [Planctomycetaceae bacterium]|nr:energy-coupling factor ABC transporter permease [Planctomycetaceae bacterium]